MRIRADQRRNRVQCIKEKMWIDLAGERVQPRLHQQPLLLLQLTLIACVIPDLQRKNNGKKRSNVNGADRERVWAWLGRPEIEDISWEQISESLAKKFGEENRQQKDAV